MRSCKKKMSPRIPYDSADEPTMDLKPGRPRTDPADVVALEKLLELERVFALRRQPIEMGSALHELLCRLNAHVATPRICRRDIAVAFDGVIHPSTPMTSDPYGIANPPVKGAFLWLTEMVEHFTIHVVSHRARTPDGLRSMQSWFLNWGLDPAVLGALMFPYTRPDVHVTIDARCIPFRGVFPTAEDIDCFQSWYEAFRGDSP